MKRVRIQLFACLLTIFLFGFHGNKKDFEPAFSQGEFLTYRLNYGLLGIGQGSFHIGEEPKKYKGYDCYRVSANGSSAGLLRWLVPVEDEWGALIRMEDFKPLYTFRNIKEGRYQLNEEVFIDPEEGILKVESVKPHRKITNRPTRNYRFDSENNVHDLMSGLMALRNTDFRQIHKGDTLGLTAFFEDTFYDFEIIFAGREELKTKFGRLKALKLVPLMPENAVFDGKHALEVWFSDDINRLPLKITAKMFIGKASAELISYQNIKYGLDSE